MVSCAMVRSLNTYCLPTHSEGALPACSTRSSLELLRFVEHVGMFVNFSVFLPALENCMTLTDLS